MYVVRRTELVTSVRLRRSAHSTTPARLEGVQPCSGTGNVVTHAYPADAVSRRTGPPRLRCLAAPGVVAGEHLSGGK